MLAAVAGVSVWAMLASGCFGDQCDSGQIECRGNELWTCTTWELGPSWNRMSCGEHRYCRIGTTDKGARAGICAAEPDPEPSCAAAKAPAGGGAASACTSDGRAVTCGAGYVYEILATCTSPELCIASATPAICAVSSTPDNRCPVDSGHTTTCVGDHALTCAAGYLAADEDCGPGLCDDATPVPFGRGCLASRTPDPRCTALSGGTTIRSTSGCEGNVRFECLDDLYVRGTDCGIDYCTTKGTNAECRKVKG